MKLFLLSVLAAFASTSAQVRCPDGFTAPVTYTGYCYKYNPATLTWNGHENACTQVTLNGAPFAGGHLATIFDQPSATVVMNQYCNGLNQGQTHYFIGYYCISSSYTYRPDWRWASGKPTTWIHNSPSYLSGAEPDDFGCGRAHYSDDGAIPGKIGDWSCTRALSGGCCEAPVVPTPSASITATQTATSTQTMTGTRTRTASNTETGTRTAAATGTSTATQTATTTRTGTRSSSETRTGTSTASSTNTATATATATVTLTKSPSVSVSVSPSVSASVTVTPSQSPSVSVSTSVTASNSISFTPRPIAIGLPDSLNDGSAATAAAADAVTVGGEEQMAALEAAAAKEAATNVVIIASSGAAGLALLLGLCCAWWVVCARRRRKEEKARQKLARKSHVVQTSKISKQAGGTVAGTLGLKSGGGPKETSGGPGMKSLFGSMNPSLVSAVRRPSMAAQGRPRPRMSMALAAYKNSAATRQVAFRPVAYRSSDSGALLNADSVQNSYTETYEDQDEVFGVQEDNADTFGVQEDNAELDEEHANIDIQEEVDQEADEEDDAVDEEEAIDATTGRKVPGKSAHGGGWRNQKEKKTNVQSVAPPVEQKKLVIGKGALLQEQVEKQTVKLRRVSKVKGDKDLTALRTGNAGRLMRPSVTGQAGFEPQRPMSYAFTATVSRTVVKTPATDDLKENSIE